MTGIMKWRVIFYGKRAGAIGAVQEYDIIVETPTIDEAKAKVYEEYEHCQHFRFEPHSYTYPTTH